MTSISGSLLNIPYANEAKTFDALHNGRWRDLIREAGIWGRDEAFSARPRLLASAVAQSVMDEAALGVRIAEAGLVTNPGNPGLINNIAFGLVVLGKPEEALKVIENVDRTQLNQTEAICLFATIGMANFRLGKVEDGTRQYEQAIEAAKRAGLHDLETLAALYFARERVLQDHPVAMEQFRKAHQAAEKNPGAFIRAVADWLKKEVTDIAVKRGGNP